LGRRDWIVDLDEYLDVDSNVVLDGNVDLDPCVDLDPARPRSSPRLRRHQAGHGATSTVGSRSSEPGL